MPVAGLSLLLVILSCVVYCCRKILKRTDEPNTSSLAVYRVQEAQEAEGNANGYQAEPQLVNLLIEVQRNRQLNELPIPCAPTLTT